MVKFRNWNCGTVRARTQMEMENCCNHSNAMWWGWMVGNLESWKETLVTWFGHCGECGGQVKVAVPVVLVWVV